MTATYDSIASSTLSSTTSSVTFSNISGSYNDLVLVWQGSNTSASNGKVVSLRFNGDTGSNYYRMIAYSSGPVLYYGDTATSLQIAESVYNNTLGAMAKWDLFGYSSGKRNKIVLSKLSRSLTDSHYISGGFWRNTAAITSIEVLFLDGFSFSVGSTFTLYGIKAE